MAHDHDPLLVHIELQSFLFQQCTQVLATPLVDVLRILHRSVEQVDLRTESVFWRDDNESFVDKERDLFLRDHGGGAENETTGVEDERCGALAR